MELVSGPKTPASLRCQAAQRLAEIGHRDLARQTLNGVVSDKRGDARARREAALALAKVGYQEESKEALITLAQASLRPSILAEWVVEDLAQLSTPAAPSSEHFVQILRNTNAKPGARVAAAREVVKRGFSSEEVSTTLAEIALNEEGWFWGCLYPISALIDLGHLDVASSCLDQLVVRRRIKGWQHAKIAEQYRRVGRPDRHSRSIRLALRQRMTYPVGCVRAAAVLAKMDMRAQAKEVLLTVAQNSQDMEAYHLAELARELNKLGDLENAVRVLHEAAV